MRNLCWRGLSLVAACLAGLVGLGLASAAEAPSTARLGKKIENLSLRDENGKPLALYDFKGKQAIVVVFLSFDCPVSTSYAPTLGELAKAYGEKGVAFVGICPGKGEASLTRQVRDFGIPFPVCADDAGEASDALKAEVTPEAFVLDKAFTLRYRGRIDNTYAARLKKNGQTTKHDLRQALDEVLAGKAVSEPATVAVGCPVGRAQETKRDGKITFYRDVLPVVQNNCQSCHRPGEVGPFALMTYQDAVKWASDIKEFTQNRKMPPWKPAEGLPFHGERRLTSTEMATLAGWVDAGTPAGDAKDAPPAREFPKGWHLGKPDLVLTPTDDFRVGPSGNDVFRCFVLPTGLTEDQFVTAVEVRPGNPKVVHHALLFIDRMGRGRKLEQQEQEKRSNRDAVDGGPGYSTGMGGIGFVPQGGLSGWAPGQLGRELPEGTGFYLPKNSDVIMQLHYHRDGKAETDRTQIGLYFAKKPVKTPWKGLIIPGFFDTIPADDAHFKVTGGIVTQQDCVLRSVMPHMHMVGQSVTVTIQPPDGDKRTLVAIKDWDYNWQETYFLQEPLPLKAGTRLEVQAVYDNSPRNPSNPSSPPRDVSWGEQTTNEMCYIFLGATTDEKPGPIKFKMTDQAAALKFALRRNQERRKADDERTKQDEPTKP